MEGITFINNKIQETLSIMIKKRLQNKKYNKAEFMHLSDITGSFSLYIDIDFIIGTQFTDEIHNEKTSIFSECGTPQNRGRHTRPHHTRRNDTVYPCVRRPP